MLSALCEANMSRLDGDNISAAQWVEHPFRRTEVVGEGTAVAAVTDTSGSARRIVDFALKFAATTTDGAS
jgi:hypothetical protein